MDINKKSSSQKKFKFANTKLCRYMKKIKSLILPDAKKERKNRISQYKDLGVFIASVSLIVLLEK